MFDGVHLSAFCFLQLRFAFFLISVLVSYLLDRASERLTFKLILYCVIIFFFVSSHFMFLFSVFYIAVFVLGFNGGLVRDFLILETAVRLHFSWGVWVGFGNSSNMASTGQTVQ